MNETLDYMRIRTIDGEYDGDTWKRLNDGTWIENKNNGFWLGDDSKCYELKIIETSDCIIEVAYLVEELKPKKVWTKEKLWAVLEVNDDQLAKALVALYNRQTEDEKETKETTEQNGIGFNGVDSTFLSSVAESFKKYGKLTSAQTNALRKALKKYRGQLVEIANAKYSEIK